MGTGIHEATDVLTSIAWGAVALVAALAMAQAFAEWRSLRRLAQLANRPEKLKRAVGRLQKPHRPVIRAFVESMRRGSSTDEALTRALIQGAQLPFAPPPLVHALSVVATVFAVLTPLSWALISSSEQLARLYGALRPQPLRTRYLGASDQLHPAFESLGAAFVESAFIVAALALAWAVRWWLSRPEVREARLVRALVQCAGRLRPGANAPVGTRLAELLAPERGMSRPVLAGLLCIIAVTTGWLLLLGGIELHLDAKQAQTFNVWPQGTERRIESQNKVTLPRSDAGSPIVGSDRPSLTFAPSAVLFHNTTLATLADGELTWLEQPPDLERELADFPRPLEVTVLGHHRTPIAPVAEVMKTLAQRYQVQLYHLIVERGVGIDGAHRLQASLPVEPRISPDARATLRIEDEGVRLMPSNFVVGFNGVDWSLALRERIRLLPRAGRAEGTGHRSRVGGSVDL